MVSSQNVRASAAVRPWKPSKNSSFIWNSPGSIPVSFVVAPADPKPGFLSHFKTRPPCVIVQIPVVLMPAINAKSHACGNRSGSRSDIRHSRHGERLLQNFRQLCRERGIVRALDAVNVELGDRDSGAASVRGKAVGSFAK